MKNLAQKQVLVLGLGASGLALARWCVRCGAGVTVADTRTAPPQLPALQQALPQVRFIAGPFTAELIEQENFDWVLKSPGLSPADVAPVVNAAQAKGAALGNELSLFAQALKELGEPTAEPTASPSAEPEKPLETSDSAAQPPLDLNRPVTSEQAIDSPGLTGEQDGKAAGTANAEATAEAVAAHLPLTADVDAVMEAAPEALADVGLLADDAPVQDEEASEPFDLAALVEAPAPVNAGYKPKVIAITGTNGKTTVTSLTGQLVQRAGKTVAVAGNIGPSLLDTLSERLDSGELPDVWVLELSSFQLDQVIGFEPSVATVLNISQDHLDWHGSMQAYAEAKRRIYGVKTVMLLNRNDAEGMKAVPELVKGKQLRPYLTFGSDEPQRPGDYGIEMANGMAWLVRASEADETIKRRKNEEIPLYIQRLMPVDALRIRGRHNATNALAALGLAVAAGCTMAPLLHGLRDYRGEPHRVEPVAVVNDVEYFDDSKGTNVGATAAALVGLGVERKLVVILGGEGKGQDFSPLAEPVSRYARAVVLIGRDAPLIRTALEQGGTVGVHLHDASSLQQAVEMAAGIAQAGDAVLMSPACASFDMFENYKHRARVFCDAVHELAQDAGVFV